MKLIAVVILGALVLSPVVAALVASLGFDPLPGDLAFHLGTWHIVLPLTYSLCASMGMTLLYLIMKG